MDPARYDNFLVDLLVQLRGKVRPLQVGYMDGFCCQRPFIPPGELVAVNLGLLFLPLGRVKAQRLQDCSLL